MKYHQLSIKPYVKKINIPRQTNKRSDYKDFSLYKYQ